MTKYPFNFTGDSSGPKISEITDYINKTIYVSLVKPCFIIYEIGNSSTIQINEPIEMLVLSTTNPAHSLGEFTSFLEYYTSSKNEKKICINTLIIDYMPFLYGLIKQFIPETNILIVKSNTFYNFSNITFRRNHHFVYTTNWNTIPFTKEKNLLRFYDLQTIKNTYLVDCTKIFNKIEEIYNTYKHLYTLYDSIAIIKTTKEKFSVSIHRAIKYPDNSVLSLFKHNNIQFIEISQFKDIYEYICTIYHAKNIVFSYGGPICINRFFCNPTANLIILANLHYQPEYNYGVPNEYWHVRHAMLAPVKSQNFILDFDNELTIKNIEQILSLINSNK